MKKIKISQLPLCNTLKGLFTMGTDDQNRSVKVPLEFIETETNAAVNAATAALNVAKETASLMDAQTTNCINATNDANELIELIKVAEEERDCSEESRQSAESTRVSKESARVNAENERLASEQLRLDAEIERQEAEIERINAEAERNSTEKDRQEAEEERVMAEEVRKNAKVTLFDDLLSAATKGAVKIDHSHVDEANRSCPYLLNGIWLTYEEAKTVYGLHSRGVDQTECYAQSVARTNIPVGAWNGNYERFAQNNANMEVAVIPYVAAGSSLFQAFYGCSKLRSCTINAYSPSTVENMFIKCSKLESLKFRGLNKSLSLVDSPLLTLDSLTYLINNAANNKAKITITLHKDVYSKVTDEENAEWFALLALASSKNITFATI